MLLYFYSVVMVVDSRFWLRQQRKYSCQYGAYV